MNGKRAVHKPVLLKEVLHYLKPVEKESLMIDANLGEGGHSEAFLREFSDLSVVGIEVDSDVAHIAEMRLRPFASRFKLLKAWSNEFFSNYDSYSERAADRVLFDLGVSTFHYERSGRGFSFNRDEPLDMRLAEDGPHSAEEIVNSYREEELADVLYKYGEERYSRRIARRIVHERQDDPITSSKRLAEIIWRAVPMTYRRGRIHPATRSFQALRLVVNEELPRFESALTGAFEAVKEHGRIGVICFHSLEDRIAKRFFKRLNSACSCPADWPVCRCSGERRADILTKKPVRPAETEVLENPASRSARLRVVEKVSRIE